MKEKTFETPCGQIHYWVSGKPETHNLTLVFLPGLTADHRLFKKQIEYFKDYHVFSGMPPATQNPGLFNLILP